MVTCILYSEIIFLDRPNNVLAVITLYTHVIYRYSINIYMHHNK